MGRAVGRYREARPTPVAPTRGRFASPATPDIAAAAPPTISNTRAVPISVDGSRGSDLEQLILQQARRRQRPAKPDRQSSQHRLQAVRAHHR